MPGLLPHLVLEDAEEVDHLLDEGREAPRRPGADLVRHPAKALGYEGAK